MKKISIYHFPQEINGNNPSSLPGSHSTWQVSCDGESNWQPHLWDLDSHKLVYIFAWKMTEEAAQNANVCSGILENQFSVKDDISTSNAWHNKRIKMVYCMEVYRNCCWICNHFPNKCENNRCNNVIPCILVELIRSWKKRVNKPSCSGPIPAQKP